MNSLYKYLIGIFFGVVIVGAGIYMYQNKDNGTPNPEPSSATTASITPSPVPTSTSVSCTSDNFVGSLTKSEGTAGTLYYTLELKNNSEKSCTYEGKVVARLVADNGTTLQESSTTISSPLIVPGQGILYSAVGFPDVSAYSPNTCKSGVDSLAIILPGESHAITIKGLSTLRPGYTNMACDGFRIQPFTI